MLSSLWSENQLVYANFSTPFPALGRVFPSPVWPAPWAAESRTGMILPKVPSGEVVCKFDALSKPITNPLPMGYSVCRAN